MPLITMLVVLVLLGYVFFVRPAIRELPLFDPFFDWIEPYEQALWKRSRTILVGRLYWIPGAAITVHDLVAKFVATGADLKPVTTRLLEYVPPDLRGVAIAAFVFFTGVLINHLRKVTTEPLDEKK